MNFKNRRYFISWLLILCCIVMTQCSTINTRHINETVKENSPEKLKENILLILLDDFGINDLGINNDFETRTPTLNQLAKQGVMYPRHYTDSTCAPSRAALLTGLRPSKLGFTPIGLGISPEVTTLPEILKQAGYSTEHIGKWHLGHRNRLAWPDKQGFDRWFGFLNQFQLRSPQTTGPKVYRRPTYYNPWLQSDSHPPKKFTGHLTNILTDKAISSIKKQQNLKPWFINLWFYAPHTPIQPEKKFIKDKTPKGKYLALIEQLDLNIDRVIKTLEETDQLDNTIIIIASDNGGTNWDRNNNAPFDGAKASYEEGGIRTPLIIVDPKRRFRYSKKAVSLLDITPSLAQLVSKREFSFDGNSLLKTSPPPSISNLLWVFETSLGTAVSFLYNDLSPRVNYLQINQKSHLDTPPPHLDNLKNTFLQDKTVNYESQTIDNYYSLSGDSFRRISGYGGYSFSFALTPTFTSEENILIAEQNQHWRILLKNNNLEISAYGNQLLSRPLASNTCSKITLSMFFNRSDLHPESEINSWIKLFINDELEDSLTLPSPNIRNLNMTDDTLILNSNFYSGYISMPFIFRGVMDNQDSVLPNIKDIPELCTSTKNT